MFTTRSLRPISGTTLFFFLWMTLYPAVSAAVGQDQATPPAAQAEPDTLDSLRELAGRAHAKVDRSEDGSDEEKQLLKQADKLDTEEQQAEAEFAQTRKHLEDHHLPDEIKQRHAAALAGYRAKMRQLKQLAQGFKAAHGRKDKAAARGHLKEMADFLGKEQKHRQHQPFDPKHLPFGTPDGNVRAPKESKQELDELVRPPQTLSLAASELLPGMLAQNDPGATPIADDLASTEDAPLTDAIKAQAAALHHNPVEIYNWVRNSVEFLPTYGSIQGRDLTLQTLRGNAFDTASLLVALLRASNIPARYAYGTIQVPAAQVMNWVGGTATPEAAQDLLGQGGIPTIAVKSGGKIAAFRLEHVWVEAFVDYIPSRGAVNKQGDTWVPLDAAFKQFNYQAYVDIRQDAPFNAQTFIDVLNNGITSNDQEGWVTGVNVAALELAYQQANTEIQAWFDKVLSAGKDWRRLQTLVGDTYPILVGSLPYKVLSQAAAVSSLPESQRRSFSFNLYADEMSRSVGSPILSYHTSLPALAAKRLTLGFAPASDADWTTIKSYLPTVPQGQALTPADLPSTLPGNLIRLTAVLLLDGQPILRGGNFTMGQDVFSTTTISRLTGGFHEARNAHLVGEFLAIGIDLQGYSEQQLRKSPVRTTASVLHQAAVAYFHRRDFHLDYLRLLGQAVAYPAPSFGFFGTSLTPHYRFGIPTQVKLNGFQVDVDASAQSLVPLDKDPDAKIRLTTQLGMALSAREHEIPESHLANDQYPGQGVSAVKALTVALGQGQRLYHITTANLDTALAQAVLSPEIETDVRNAVNAGLEAQIHERPISINGWTGAGYILTDPRTGAGAYRIAGGLNGGAMASEIAEAMSFQGLSVLAGSAVDLVLNFAIPAAHADEGLCGEAQKEQVPVSNFANTLIFALLLAGILVITLPGPTKVLAPPIAALMAVFASSAAVAQARKGECYVYYIGDTTPDGVDISELSAHILGAIEAKQSAYLGLGIANLTYTPSGPKKLLVSRSWYNNQKFVGNLEDSPCGDPKSRNGLNCDEYPFFSTVQGGSTFYPEALSLKLVDAKQNQKQGSTLGAFYRACFAYKPGTAFLVQKAFGGSTFGAMSDKNGGISQCWPRPEVPVYLPSDDVEENF
ncbi:MAG: transglutaminase domain-containing protein [Methylovulum miyakonense]|uniref:transglutaminase domain-containing protein n=1 Tax=Methylovulum miyakonense TaxID=645578 RepID=UPI003BB5D2B5